MKKLVLASALTLIAFGGSAEVLIDMGTNGGYTGYAKSDTSMAEGVTKIFAYDLVCPAGSMRPADGLVTVPLQFGECVDKLSHQIAADSPSASSSCLPVTQVGELRSSSFDLGKYECYDQGTNRVTTMEKQYRQGYYVVGGDPALAGQQSTSTNGNDAGAAQAAGASAGGIYSSCTDNPFSLCSAPRPGKNNPLRACFDFLC